jgi:SAM-dependent methyltransferase
MTQILREFASAPVTQGSCPLCDSSEVSWRFEKKGRQFWLCSGCGREFQRTLPTRAELQRYYDEQFDSGMYATFTSARLMKQMTARQRLQQIQKQVPLTGRWLDVGCADGAFVKEAGSRGMTASGVELSSIGVAQATAEGLDVQTGTLDDLPEGATYDCITAFDVLEHVLDPSAFLQAISQRLVPGGYAVLTMPDVKSLFARLMGSRWWFYIPEEHLHYFHKRSVALLGSRVGLDAVHQGPAYKPLTFNYGLTQFVEFNPLIYKAMKAVSWLLPTRLKEWIVPLYIGEMIVIFRKPLATTFTNRSG